MIMSATKAQQSNQNENGTDNAEVMANDDIAASKLNLLALVPGSDPTAAAATTMMPCVPVVSSWNKIHFLTFRSFRGTTPYVQALCKVFGYPAANTIPEAFLIVCRHRDFSAPLSDHQRFNHIPGEHFMNKKDLLYGVMEAFTTKQQSALCMPMTYRLNIDHEYDALITALKEKSPLLGHVMAAHGLLPLIRENIGLKKWKPKPVKLVLGGASASALIKKSLKGEEVSSDEETNDDDDTAQHEETEFLTQFDVDETEVVPLAEGILRHANVSNVNDTDITSNQMVEYIYKPTDATAHNGNGIEALSTLRLAFLVQQLKNRNACIQSYIQRPLLLQGHKFDLRLYMLIVNVEPGLVFMHEGISRRALSAFTHDTENSDAHVTNVQRVKNCGLALTEYVTDFQELQRRLEADGQVPSEWVKLCLVPQLKQICRDVFLATQEKLNKRPRYYALLGVDVVVDDSLRPWLLEVQKSPSMDPGGALSDPQSLPFKRKIVKQLWKHSLNIQSELYKCQRMVANRIVEKDRTVNGNTAAEVGLGYGVNGCKYMRRALVEMKNHKLLQLNHVQGSFQTVLDEFNDFDVGPFAPQKYSRETLAINNGLPMEEYTD